MGQLTQQIVYEILNSASTKLIGKFAITFYLCFFSFNGLSQDSIDPAKLIFKVTVPLATEQELNPTSTNSDDINNSLINSVLLYRDAIEIIRQNNDPYNYELLEYYSSLGDAYQSLGLHEDAVDSFDNAIQISRIQNGLFHLDQIPLLEKIIMSYISMGDEENTTLRLEYMHYLHLENYTAAEPEMIRATLKLADWYIASFFKDNFQHRSAENGMKNSIVPQQARLTSGLLGNGTIASGGLPNPNATQFESILNGSIRGLHPSDVEDARLLKIGSIYEDLQHEIYATEQPEIATIIEIARRIASLSYITKQEMDYERAHFNYDDRYNNSREAIYRNSQQRMDRSYESGRDALQYVINLLRSAEVRPGLLAAAILELADWQLAYGKLAAAEASYQEVYSLMISSGATSEALDAALNRTTPTKIPMLATHFYTKKSAGLPEDTALNYQGYIDVSYTIDDHGNTSEVIFEESEQEELRYLQGLIENSLLITKFRPIIQNGELLSHGLVHMRYYYAY